MSNTTDLISDELGFCELVNCEKNEHNQFIYESKNKKSVINLPYILLEYKQWLISKKILNK